VASAEHSTAVLPLLGAAAKLVAKIGACEALLGSAVGDLAALLSSAAAAAPNAALDPVTIRLLASQVCCHTMCMCCCNPAQLKA
jgi:hypothetical protein